MESESASPVAHDGVDTLASHAFAHDFFCTHNHCIRHSAYRDRNCANAIESNSDRACAFSDHIYHASGISRYSR